MEMPRSRTWEKVSQHLLVILAVGTAQLPQECQVMGLSLSDIWEKSPANFEPSPVKRRCSPSEVLSSAGGQVWTA